MSSINRFRFFFLFFCVPAYFTSFRQSYDLPDDFLPESFHRERRQKLREKMPENTVAVFFANPPRNRSNDVDYEYHQDPDFYYLTGYREPDAVLLIFKEFQETKEGEKYNEIIFVRPNNEYDELWNGKRMGIDGVKNSLGFTAVYSNSDFFYYNPGFSKFKKVLFSPFHNDVRDTETAGDLYDLISWFRNKTGYPEGNGNPMALEPVVQNIDNNSLETILQDLREIKSPDELVLLRKAVNISCLGQVEVMKAARPGMSEREIQGIHEFVYRKLGAEAEGYPSIVGAGNHGCILHYTENYKPSIKNDELILMDLGAEYRGYTADVTRTIPVSGKFTPEQKQIYDLVYQSQEAAIRICSPGLSFDQLEKKARQVINKGLKELGIIKSSDDYHQYLPHGISHHIGLDVHDKGNYNSLKENMVITIEPGVYIPENSLCDPRWWNIAIRIEDDVLVNKNGCEVLSVLAPRQSDDVEAMMALPGALDDFILTLPQEK